MLRIVQHLIRQTGLRHFTVVHDDQTVREQPGHRQIVGHEHHGQPHVAHQMAQQVQQAGLDRHVQTAGRFVHEDEARRGHQIAGDLQTLLGTEPVVLLGLLAVVTAYLVDGSFNPFLYFRF